MSFVLSDAVLVGVQSLLVLVPGRPRRLGASAVVGLAVPGAALVVGVVVARASSGAAFLTDLAAIATPVLAATAGFARRWPRPWLSLVVVPPLFAVAWFWSGSLGGDAAGVALIAGACLAVTGVVAGLAPARWVAAGLVLLVVLDCVLVWGDRQVGPATNALETATPLSLLGHALPSLQQAQFGSVQMGWLDLAAPALLGLIVERRIAAAVATAAAAGLWDLLFFATSLIPATPPVLAGLVAGHIVRRTDSRDPAGFGPMVPEAKLEKTEHGLAPEGDGWFVLNMRDAEWRHREGRGAVCVVGDDFEGWRRFDQLGINPFVLAPGEAMSLYHWEADQEDFLVVSGEAVLVVEGKERRLRAWDFVHCPPRASHVIVGAGTGPCLVIAVGSREHSDGPDWIGFPADDAARRHGASVEADTLDPDVAYGPIPGREPTAYRDGWLPD